MKIDLLSPTSFDGGQPHGQYDWLRENAPVRWHEEPDGKGFWAVTRHADVWAVDRDFQTYSSEPTIMITDPLGRGRLVRAVQDDADDGPAGAHRLPQAHPLGIHRAAGAAAPEPDPGTGQADRRCGDRKGRMRLRRPGGRRDAVVRDRRTDGPAAGRRARALQADRDHPTPPPRRCRPAPAARR